ncbi:unnamed protein product, partial [Ixodes hexagonus]
MGTDVEPQIRRGPLSLEQVSRGTSRQPDATACRNQPNEVTLLLQPGPAPSPEQLAKSGSRFPTS